MYHFTPPAQRSELYKQMPILRAASLKAYQLFKAIDITESSLDNAMQSFLFVLDQDCILDLAWAVLGHYDRVVNDKQYREIHAQELALYEAHANNILLDPELFQKLSHSQSLLEFAGTVNRQSKALIDAIDVYLRHMKKSGSHLNTDSRAKLSEIAQEISALEQKFEENNLDASEEIIMNCSEEELQGLLPSHFELLIKNEQTGLYAINRTPLCRQSLLEYAVNRSLREKYYKDYIKKCGPEDGSWDSTGLANSLLAFKSQKAHILGFESYRALQVHDRFAGNELNLNAFYQEFFDKIPFYAHKEHERLQDFAHKRDHIDLMPWDASYYARLEEESLLNLNEDAIRQYFPISHVIQHMFTIFQEVYDLHFELRKSVLEDKLWHDDVMIVEVTVCSTGERLGRIYMDLFQRPGKMSGAWMSGFRNFATYPESQDSIVFCICNTQSKETFLLEEVQTLFHEFGHSLHSILSRQTMAICSGIDNVPWDIVELPSILSEQWVGQEEHLKNMSQHIDTKEPLPPEWIAAILKKSQYAAGKFLLRQMILGFYDWTIHAKNTSENLLDTWQNISAKYAVMPILKNDSFPMTFTHIFSGGYSSGYYSYLWAEVYVHQVYKKMQDIAQKDSWAKAGDLFKKAFLALGADRDLKTKLDVFLEDPLTIDPLMTHYGLKEEGVSYD